MFVRKIVITGLSFECPSTKTILAIENDVIVSGESFYVFPNDDEFET